MKSLATGCSGPRRLWLLTIFCVVALSACSGGHVTPAEARINGVTKLDGDTGSVELSVSAFDHQGSLLVAGSISNVTATTTNPGFNVQPGVCGPISFKGPLSTVLLLDRSGSMTSNDPRNNRAVAAKSFVRLMGADDRATIAFFAGSSYSQYTGPWFSADKVVLEEAIDNATSSPSGGTPLW